SDGIGITSIRDPEIIPRKFLRNASAGFGSDVNILGYKTEGEWKNALISSVLNNFWIAIHQGDLNVELIDARDKIVISKDTLRTLVEVYTGTDGVDLLNHYLALDQSDAEFHENIPVLG